MSFPVIIYPIRVIREGFFMRLTFPHLGNLVHALKGAFTELGAQVVVPPLNKETLTYGSRYAPESACLPFKLVLGNYIQALEEGADTLIMLGGSGPCRFGYYGNLAGIILKDLGYDFKLVVLEGQDAVRQIGFLGQELGAGWREILKAVTLGWRKLVALDEWEALVNKNRARGVKEGTVEHIYQQGIAKLSEAGDLRTLRARKKQIKNEFIKKLADPNGRTLPKIALVGDIYMQIEPFANNNIARFLGEKGFEVYRSIYLSNWAKHNFWPPAKGKEVSRLLADARPYLRSMVGGHGLDTIANTVSFWRQGFHGVIQILPMTCMPEIVAQSLLPKVSRDLGISVMSLVLDEHSGQEGLATRLEAFMDVVAQRVKLRADN